MSKSAAPGAAGVIRMLDPPDVVRRKVARAVTDSESVVRYDPDEKPGVSNLLDILGTIDDADPVELAGRFGGYGELKAAVSEAVVAVLEPIQQRYADLRADEPGLEAVLAAGAERASAQAEPVLGRARRAIGLL